MKLNINSSEIVVLTNKLEKMRKYDLPVVINQTLNDAAVDLKTVEMLEQAGKSFTNRKKGFFKAISAVKRSSGFDIRKQVSQVGFRGKGHQKEAVNNLEQQERGGNIDYRDFIPINTARTSNSYNKTVKKKNRLSQIKGLKSLRPTTIRAAYKKKVGDYVITKGTLFQVAERKKKGKFRVILKPLYDYEKGRKIKVKGTHFMEKASLKVSKKLDNMYIKNAKNRLKLK